MVTDSITSENLHLVIGILSSILSTLWAWDRHELSFLKWTLLFQDPESLSLSAVLIAIDFILRLIGCSPAIISKLAVGVLLRPLVIIRAACRCTLSSLVLM